jgi:hypothetical protein
MSTYLHSDQESLNDYFGARYYGEYMAVDQPRLVKQPDINSIRAAEQPADAEFVRVCWK